jgi:hypothetical protein
LLDHEIVFSFRKRASRRFPGAEAELHGGVAPWQSALHIWINASPVIPLSDHTQNAVSQWFRATEALGDFMGIRYGRVPHGSGEVEWFHVSHVECDGVGGFARLLRRHGAVIDPLPKTKNPCRGIIGPLWRLWRNSRRHSNSATRGDWLRNHQPQSGAPGDPAWHLFSEQETQLILEAARRQRVTVNSLLLTHLDASVRPELGRCDARLPWMVPINMRGDGKVADDTSNQVSCFDVVIAPDDSVSEVHRQIIKRLADGEHRANLLLMELGKLLGHERRMQYIARSRTKPAGNIGAFSNLGSWDAQKRIDSDDAWLFCPPLATGQRLAAGCVTFQNKLGLMIQARRDPSDPPEPAKRWMERWVARIGDGMNQLQPES